MRFLLKSTGIALGLTVILYALLRVVLPVDAWFYTFLFERSLVQWMSIAVFCFGLHLLFLKSRALPTEQRALAQANWDALVAQPAVAPPSAGMVRRRLTTIAALAAHHSPRFAENTAKEMAAEDAAELNESYALPGEVVQILPLIGFYGTVWGLSKGLYYNFVVQGQDSTNAFASAIGTAFDTTLLALALTIAMSLLQSVVRRTEESLLENLNRYVEDRLHKLDNAVASAVPASNDPKVWLEEFGINPAELIEFLRGRLSTMSDDLGKIAGGQTALTTSQAEVAAAIKGSQEDLAAQTELLRQLQSNDTTEAHTRQLALLTSLEALAKTRASDADSQAKTQAEALAALLAQLKADQAAQAGALTHLTEGVGRVESAVGQSSAQLAEKIAAAGTTAASALSDHAAKQTAAVAGLGEQIASGHKSLRDLINRPKSFTVTEKSSADDASNR